MRSTPQFTCPAIAPTTKPSRPYWTKSFRRGNLLAFSRETRGLPESLLATNAERCLSTPMAPEARSLNSATAAGIVLHEALRQLRTGHQEARDSSKKKTPQGTGGDTCDCTNERTF